MQKVAWVVFAYDIVWLYCVCDYRQCGLPCFCWDVSRTFLALSSGMRGRD